jgi:hypothetical protein
MHWLMHVKVWQRFGLLRICVSQKVHEVEFNTEVAIVGGRAEEVSGFACDVQHASQEGKRGGAGRNVARPLLWAASSSCV